MKQRSRTKIHDEELTEKALMSSDDQCLSSTTLNDHIHEQTMTSPPDLYHNSVCGSILHSIPTNNPSTIFSYLRHGNFDAFRRSYDIYHREINTMKNEHEQTVLHLLTIHTYPYKWVRLVMMRGCEISNQDKDGYTAAHYAVERDDVEMLKALTVRFHCRIKSFSDEYINTVYQRGFNALSLRTGQGLTVFMLACYHQALKCLDYLIELKINDVHLHDQFGDTCLHYAVARRNEILAKKLVSQCQADVNGGNSIRPSILDVLQFNRELQRIVDQTKDDAIESFLLTHQARNRCPLRRTYSKRKYSTDDSAMTPASNVIFSSTQNQIVNAQNDARSALVSENAGRLDEAQKNYQPAMDGVSTDVLDRAIYAKNIAMIHMIRGEHHLALELIKEALTIRRKFEGNTDEITNLESIHKCLLNSVNSNNRI